MKKKENSEQKQENNNIKFLLNGADLRFVAEAPRDMTLEQLLKQCDRIIPDYCECGICSIYAERGLGPDTDWDPETEILFQYDSVQKVSDDVSCTILEVKTDAEK